jgi:hypothetical protein
VRVNAGKKAVARLAARGYPVNPRGICSRR